MMINYIFNKMLKKINVVLCKFLSNLKYSKAGKFYLVQGLLTRGKGQISIGRGVEIGCIDSPYFYSSYCYLEAREIDSKIKIGNNVKINNNFSCISVVDVLIEDNVLIGLNVQIVDSNFHDLNVERRGKSNAKINSGAVIIGEGSFIGNNVIILKGSNILPGTVVPAGSVVR
ncbi:transferase [Shewanella halotolerans]|uniref:transferase n=1 Tax=Shewanella halotolerans TaxID=2864204 RepID=UPI001C65D1F5|nr:transferase [Shewanella halotolerans]QYJ88704.1 transferase [Shewanella halotolerans]